MMANELCKFSTVCIGIFETKTTDRKQKIKPIRLVSEVQ